jgi:hypothetical protein
MCFKGIVSSIESNGAKATFPDKNNNVSPTLKVASHVTDLKVGDNIAVVFFSNSMADGLIIARW